MRRKVYLAFDDYIEDTQSTYSSTELNDELGAYDAFVLQVVTDDVVNATAITVQLEVSSDGRRWLCRASHGRWTVDPVGSDPQDVSPFGVRDLGGNAPEWVNDKGRCSLLPGVRLAPIRGDRLRDPRATVIAWHCHSRDFLAGFRCAE